jgi:hypothetical protein
MARMLRVFDLATRIAMFATGCLMLLAGLAVLGLAALPVLGGAWLVREARL